MNHGAATFLVLVALLATASGTGSAPCVPEVIARKRLPLAEAFVGPASRGHPWVRGSTPRLSHGKSWFGVDRRPKQRRLRACFPTAVRERQGREAGGRREFIVIRASAASESEGVRDLEGWEERCIRRLDVAVRRVFAAYYTCSDLREAKEPLRVFLSEATAALEAGGSPERLGPLLEKRLLRNSERLDYHLDGDLPMVLYRLWLRGRAIDVYEQDLLHSPRWIELIYETQKQMDQSALQQPQQSGDRMGTICYPNGNIFEGEVDSLVRSAKKSGSSTIDGGKPGPSTPAPPNDALDVEFFPPSCATTTTTTSSFSENVECGNQSLIVEPDVTTVEGLVALTIDCLRDGLSDESTIFQRHMKSPDFGNPLLRIASPSSDLTEFPHIPGEGERDPAMVAAEAELTEEHMKLGERGAKELVHGRRRSHLDVYLICEAYRALRATGAVEAAPVDFGVVHGTGWQLCEEDARILDRMVKDATVVDP